jgi:hypothetical protein
LEEIIEEIMQHSNVLGKIIIELAWLIISKEMKRNFQNWIKLKATRDKGNDAIFWRIGEHKCWALPTMYL